MTIALVFIAAFTLGFAAHRASLCTVKAVAEIYTTRSVYMLASFLKTSIWILIFSFLGFALFGVSTSFTHWPLSIYSILGGLLFGFGAAMNGGCTFSTLTRLGDGDIAFLAAVIGWPTGAWVERILLSSWIPGDSEIGVSAYNLSPAFLGLLATLAVVVWIVWQSTVIFRHMPKGMRLVSALMAPQYGLTMAAVIIAAANFVLYLNLNAWSYTSVILSSVAPATFPPKAPILLLWFVLSVSLAGIITSSVLRKSFSFKKPTLSRLFMHSAAGIMMGFGAAMIPGGNDSIILYGISSLSPHAAPAYISILVGIALTFFISKRFGASIPPIYCVADTCMMGPPPTGATPLNK